MIPKRKAIPLGPQPLPARGDPVPDYSNPSRRARVVSVVPFFKNNWIEHEPQTSLVNQLLAYMESMQPLLDGPIDGRCLSQDTNAGKSRMIEALVAEAALRREEEGLPSNKYQIIVVELNEATSVKSFFRNILKALDDSHWNNKHDTIDDLEDRIHHFCRKLGVQGLVGDEVQHLDKKSSDATGVTNRLKSFLNRGIVPLILVGNEKAEAFFEKNTDLAARLGTPLVLKPLDPRNDRTDGKLFTAFCKKLDASMVKAKIVDEPAGLDKAGLRSQLVAVSGGHVGRVCRVVCEATIHALWRGSPKVEKHDLSVATRRYAMGPVNWVTRDPFSSSK
ncbi:RNA binding exosome subunit [Sphingomonas sp. SORGH_AS870]|uniref:TniB family NTP-binding protein n=1 Tax=Sphingomonas sp. SORGH_AS_0870 TaxID=3041801 RepID=UPI00285E9C29|nr:TniB family NTP-binding protein [Sphingomonas sp. SORGH_AS_0870]MDR6144903.1 RNA binding exosome subunit [Sphingomonas sp. SORGH_AS_0870]